MSTRILRFLAAIAFAGVAAVTLAEQMSAYPAMSLADGRSTVTIKTTVLDASGHPVPDGTRVAFSTTLGTFRDSLVTTINGTAQAILVASNTPGTATITAIPLAGGSGPATLQYEFVADRALLSSAREFIEVVAPALMTYRIDLRTIGANASEARDGRPSQKVFLRYREIEVEADQIQLGIQGYELRAKNATLKVGKVTYPHPFSSLFMHLNTRSGFGITTYAGHVPQYPAFQGRWLAFGFEGDDGRTHFGPPPARDRYGLVAIKGAKLTPSTTTLPPDDFKFADMVGAPSHITAKRAIVFPMRRIQFQRADIYVAETRVLRVPYYQINLLTSSSPLITEEWFAVQDNQIEINYPLYVDLKPGQSQDFRFHTGDISSRDGDATSGAFLDYELNWNRGDDMEGGFALRNLATNQFEVDLQQYLRIDNRTSMSASLGVPIDSGYYGAASVNHQFNGLDTSLTASASQTFRGLDVRSTDYAMTAMTTPVTIKHTPLNYSYGFTAQDQSNSLLTQSQQVYGPTAVIRSNPIKLTPKSTLTTSFTASQLEGQNAEKGVTMLGNATFTQQVSKQFSATVAYNYTHDNFNDQVIGQHQVSTNALWSSGRTSLSIFAMRSLDLDRETIFGDFDYRLSKLWRFRTSYTFDRYLTDTDMDYTFAVSYHIGWREIGLMWSARTRRFGILLLGATIN